MRYISQRLQVVSKIPFVWSEFIWPFYDYREEHSVMNVLSDCGDYIKRLIFPNHVTPQILFRMLGCCNWVTQLSLPPGTTVDCEELRIAVQHMKHLEKLEVQLASDIKPLLQISGLKELTVHIPEESHALCAPWVQEWMKNRFMPYNLNFITEMFDFDAEMDFLKSLLEWKFTPLAGYTSYFKLYYDFLVPLNLFPSLPEFQLEFSHTIVFPFVKASSYGLQALDKDILVLTDCTCNGKKFYKAESESHSSYFAFHHTNNILNSDMVNNLSSVTEFNFSYSQASVHSGHLEQLAIACPNLQRLSLQGNYYCLKTLKGLCTIGSRCHNLCGLSLKYIQVSDIESHLRLWEILSNMKLTHIVMEVCVFHPGIDKNNHDTYENQLVSLYQKCSSLEALEFETFQDERFCVTCKDIAAKWSLLSCFPVLKYCNMVGDDSDLCIQNALGACKKLVAFSCTTIRKHVRISSVCNVMNLQQLWINSMGTNIPNIFMETVSTHGRLLHVFLSIFSITVDGICSLIANSPSLLTFKIHSHIVEGCTWDATVSVGNFIQEKFPGKKLFAVGGFVVDLHPFNFVLSTDLMPLWHEYHSS